MASPGCSHWNWNFFKTAPIWSTVVVDACCPESIDYWCSGLEKNTCCVYYNCRWQWKSRITGHRHSQPTAFWTLSLKMPTITRHHLTTPMTTIRPTCFSRLRPIVVSTACTQPTRMTETMEEWLTDWVPPRQVAPTVSRLIETAAG